MPTRCSFRPTKFEPCTSIGLACRLERKEEVHILCTCPVRAMCSPDQLLIERCDAPVHLCHCAEFVITNAKYHKLGGSMLIKLSPLWHLLFVPPSTGNHNGTCPHPQKCCRLTNLEPCPSIGSGFSLEKRGENSVHVPSTSNEHPKSTFHAPS